MAVIRVADKKNAGNKGSKDVIAVNQKYAIYRQTTSGLNPIGSAQVIVVKSSVCGLDILYNNPELPVDLFLVVH